ncbi:unnamed protein product [Arctogadus glacialis]
MMVLRMWTWRWRQYSLRRVGSFQGNSLPQPTLPGESWLTSRATEALNIVLPEKLTVAASRFEAEAEESLRSAEIPLLPDFKDLLCCKFTSPSFCRWSRQTKVFSNMAVDEDLAPLFQVLCSLFGGPACLNKDSKAMESLLGKLHRSMAMQARLDNTATILNLYTHHLSGLMQNQPVDASLEREFQSATMCLASVSKEKAVASGRSLTQLWVVRRHLWLSQSKLQPADRHCLLRVPVESTAMFGPQAVGGIGQGAQKRLHLGRRLSDGFPKALQSPTLVEGPSQHQEGADYGIAVNKTVEKGGISVLIRSPVLRKRFLIIALAWFASSLTFSCLGFNVGNLGLDIFLTELLFGITELPAHLLCFWLLELAGRKLCLMSTLLVGGLVCLSILAVPAGNAIAVTVLAITSRILVTVGIGICAVYIQELFPTPVRHTAAGLGCVAARLGGLLAPPLNLLALYHWSIPVSVFSSITLVGGALIFLLPETCGRELADSIEQAEVQR